MCFYVCNTSIFRQQAIATAAADLYDVPSIWANALSLAACQATGHWQRPLGRIEQPAVSEILFGADGFVWLIFCDTDSVPSCLISASACRALHEAPQPWHGVIGPQCGSGRE